MKEMEFSRIKCNVKRSNFNLKIFPHLSFSSGAFVPSAFAAVEPSFLSFAICRRSSLRSFSSSRTRDLRLSISSFCSRISLSCFQMHAFRVSTNESTLVRASRVDCSELILALQHKRKAPQSVTHALYRKMIS